MPFDYLYVGNFDVGLIDLFVYDLEIIAQGLNIIAHDLWQGYMIILSN